MENSSSGEESGEESDQEETDGSSDSEEELNTRKTFNTKQKENISDKKATTKHTPHKKQVLSSDSDSDSDLGTKKPSKLNRSDSEAAEVDLKKSKMFDNSRTSDTYRLQ